MNHKLMKKVNEKAGNVEFKSDHRETFQQGIFAGIGWAFGVTIGFVMISVILVFVLRSLGGLPIIGNWIAAIVETTLDQLSRRTPTILQ